ncbi:UNVERIFIED_CONTAM: hypothetical protein Sradi_6595700 [Sesamum radiatum]|uniref:Defensin-like protein n=1 Tax=Sesamum radiatum TaxID=300843 RepID=A0AAW2JY25_SESRA
MDAGFWYSGDGAVCEKQIDFATCDKAHPGSCDNICRSGLFFPPYSLIRSVCEERFKYGKFQYYCACLWECDARSRPQAHPPTSHT